MTVLVLHIIGLLWLAPSLFFAGVVYWESRKGGDFDRLRTCAAVIVWPIVLAHFAGRKRIKRGS